MRRIVIRILVLVALLAIAQVRLDKGEPVFATKRVKPILVFYAR